MKKVELASGVNTRGDKFRVTEGAEGWGYYIEACESSKGLRRYYKVGRRNTLEEAIKYMAEVMTMGDVQ